MQLYKGKKHCFPFIFDLIINFNIVFQWINIFLVWNEYVRLMVIEHQPGSSCSGDIFANVYNVKLSFWLTENSVITSKNITNIKEHNIDTAKQMDEIQTSMLYLLWRPDKEYDDGNYESRIDCLMNGSIALIETSIVCSPQKWEQAFNLLIENSPTLIWKSKWLSQKSWKTPLYIDVIGKTCSYLPLSESLFKDVFIVEIF